MTEHKFETPLTEAFVTAVCNENKRLNEQINRLREALWPFVEPCIEHCYETCESEEERMEDCICFKARAALG